MFVICGNYLIEEKSKIKLLEKQLNGLKLITNFAKSCILVNAPSSSYASDITLNNQNKVLGLTNSP